MAAKATPKTKKAKRPFKTRQRATIFDSADLSAAMFKADTNYASISGFYNSDRRTGHRWLQKGPSDPVARNLQLILSLGLTLTQADFLIRKGVALGADGKIPRPFLDIGKTVKDLMAAEEAAKEVTDDGSDTRPARGKNPARG